MMWGVRFVDGNGGVRDEWRYETKKQAHARAQELRHGRKSLGTIQRWGKLYIVTKGGD